MKTSSTQRVIEAFENGERLTAKQISSRYGVANPTALITNLRQRGYPIYLNEHKNVSKYRLGTPTRNVVAAGYKALASA